MAKIKLTPQKPIRMAEGRRLCDPNQTFQMPEYKRRPLHARFREVRKAHGLSLGQAAEKLGITVAECSGMESGAYDFDMEHVYARFGPLPEVRMERKKHVVRVKDIDTESVILLDVMATSKDNAERAVALLVPLQTDLGQVEIKAVTPAEISVAGYVKEHREAVETLARLESTQLAELLVAFIARSSDNPKTITDEAILRIARSPEL